MSTKEALEALIGGQAFEFRSKIEDELAARSLEAIQTKRFEVGASMFGNEVVEEVEKLDELDDKTLKSYKAKATMDKIVNRDKMGKIHKAAGKKYQGGIDSDEVNTGPIKDRGPTKYRKAHDAAADRVKKRTKGIATADKKLEKRRRDDRAFPGIGRGF